MVTQTYTCDKCGASGTQVERQNASEYIQLWNIHLQYQCHPTVPGGPGYTPAKAQWCRACMEKMGLLHDSRKKAVVESQPHPPATLEDVIREIINEEIENSLAQRQGN